MTVWEELWKRPNFIRATVDAGIDGEKAASLWNGVVLKSNKDATEDDLKSESVEYSLRKSSRFADETMTFQEKAARAWKEMQSKSAEDGGRSWLEDSPLARMCTQAESLEASIKAVAKRLPIERTHLLPIAGVLDISSSMKSAETEKSLEGLMENVKEQCTLMSQLATSTRTVTNELMQLLKKRKAAQQKVEDKKKTQAMKAEEQQGELEKLRLQKKKKMNPFFIDFKAVPKARVFTDADFATATDDDYLKPFILSGSKLISVLMSESEDDKSLMSGYMGRWKASFPTAKQFQSHGAVIAPVMKARSEDAALLQLLSKLLPDAINNEFPALLLQWALGSSTQKVTCSSAQTSRVSYSAH